MTRAEQTKEFLHDFAEWAQVRPDIVAAALVGSYASHRARDDSDVDLVIVSSRPEQYLADLSWTSGFGPVDKHEIENYGKVTSVRVWYADGLEVEFGITDEEWASLPLDEGTSQVISKGMVVLVEQGDLLSRHQPEDHSGESATGTR